jgi:hypothetical protein
MCLNVVYVLFCYFDLSIWMICICDVSDITIPLLPLGSCFVDSYADFLVIWYLDRLYRFVVSII